MEKNNKPRVVVVGGSNDSAAITCDGMPSCSATVLHSLRDAQRYLRENPAPDVLFLDLVEFKGAAIESVLDEMLAQPGKFGKTKKFVIASLPEDTCRALHCIRKGALRILQREPDMRSVRALMNEFARSYSSPQNAC